MKQHKQKPSSFLNITYLPHSQSVYRMALNESQQNYKREDSGFTAQLYVLSLQLVILLTVHNIMYVMTTTMMIMMMTNRQFSICKLDFVSTHPKYMHGKSK